MDDNDAQIRSYYKARAAFYDRVYAQPERQRDLRYLEHYIPSQFVGRTVLEIAAGTGYWTQFIAAEAASLVSTDATPEVLEQAKKRPNTARVSFRVADAYRLDDISEIFDGVFAGLWFSHVPRQKAGDFFAAFQRLVKPGAIVLFVDNSLVQCGSMPISHTDEYGNTYQQRQLDDGSVYRVLKNFPSKDELFELTKDFAASRSYLALENFWLFQYVVK